MNVDSVEDLRGAIIRVGTRVTTVSGVFRVTKCWTIGGRGAVDFRRGQCRDWEYSRHVLVWVRPSLEGDALVIPSLGPGQIRAILAGRDGMLLEQILTAGGLGLESAGPVTICLRSLQSAGELVVDKDVWQMR